MDCKEIIDAYIDCLKERFVVEALGDGCVIQTPYLDPSNDPICIYVKKENNNLRISDQAQAIEYLFLHGVNITPKSKQQWYIDTILNRLKVKLSEEELRVDATNEEIGDAILRLVGAISSVEHLLYTAKPRRRVDFREEVALWFLDNGIVAYRNKEFIGASGKSVTIDFVIPRKAKNPAYLYALHSDNLQYAKALVNNTIVAWFELKNAGEAFYSSCILDDAKEEFWSGFYPLLAEYTDKVTFWEERDKLLELLM